MRLRFLMNRVLLTTSVLALFSCAPVNGEILEFRDVQDFSVHQQADGNEVYIQVSGLAFHSSLSVDSIEIKRIDNDLMLYVHLVPAALAQSGRFNASIPVPKDIEKVFFGKERYLIWSSQ